ncbi:MAG: aminotransferase class V-fold PLP-dependent enzyme [Acidimicrobiales bacterium]
MERSPEREEAGSPNVFGAVAFSAAARTLAAVGWRAIRAHDELLASRLHTGLGSIEGVPVLVPGPPVPTLPMASLVVEGVHHSLAAARRLRNWVGRARCRARTSVLRHVRVQILPTP